LFSAHENNPLSNAIGNLMQLMTRAAGEGIITPQLAFISYFIQTMAEITSIKTKEVMRPLLTLIPPALVNRFKKLTSEFSFKIFFYFFKVFYMLAVWPGLMSISDVAKLLAHSGDEMGVGKIAAQIVCAFKNIN
jgi:hypothetical protein